MPDANRTASHQPAAELLAEAHSKLRPGAVTAAAVAAALRTRIQDGKLAPGEWLREARLCAEFKVGRTIVGNALGILTDDGLVKHEENRGAYVATATLHEVFDLFELRAAVYGAAARFTCIRGSNTLISEIVALIDEMLAAAGAGAAADDLIRRSEVIFSRMASTASFDTQRVIESLRRKTRWHFSYVSLAESPGGRGPAKFWLKIRAALVARDSGQAAEGARNVLFYMQSEVMRIMVAQGQGLPPATELRAVRTSSRPRRRKTKA